MTILSTMLQYEIAVQGDHSNAVPRSTDIHARLPACYLADFVLYELMPSLSIDWYSLNLCPSSCKALQVLASCCQAVVCWAQEGILGWRVWRDLIKSWSTKATFLGVNLVMEYSAGHSSAGRLHSSPALRNTISHCTNAPASSPCSLLQGQPAPATFGDT